MKKFADIADLECILFDLFQAMMLFNTSILAIILPIKKKYGMTLPDLVLLHPECGQVPFTT